MRVEDARIGQRVRGPTGWVGIVHEIKKHELVVGLPNGLDYGLKPSWVTSVDGPRSPCQKLAGELGEKDAEITGLKCELDEVHRLLCRANNRLAMVETDRDRLAETVRFQDEMIREMSEDSIPAFEQDRLRRDARIILELMASCLPLSLPDISDRLGWKMPRVCETMAMLRIAGKVKLEEGEYSLVVK
jgi:hypothetical protein